MLIEKFWANIYQSSQASDLLSLIFNALVELDWASDW